MSLLANTWFQKAATAAAGALALFLLALTLKTFAEYRYVPTTLGGQATIAVTGTGEVFAVPNIASFTVTVRKEAKTAPEAQKQAAEAINAIVAFLKKEGIAEKDMRTTAYNLSPRYEWRENCMDFDRRGTCDRERVLVGYEAMQQLRVKVRETDKAGILIGKLSELGADNVSSLSFEVDDEEALKEEARAKAIADAKEKAQKLADALGVHLVRIISFEEGGAPRPFPLLRSAKIAAFDAAKAPAPEIPMGENKITSTVTIIYEIQ